MNQTPTPAAQAGKNKRACPATNGFITPAECGAQRGDKLACPPQCPFFPFGSENLDLWVKVDQGWVNRAAEYLGRRWSPDRIRNLSRQVTIPMPNKRLEQDCAFFNGLYRAFFTQRDENGKNLADLWEAENWVGLNNDERVMMRCRRLSFPTVLEVERIIDNRSVLMLDLLAPGSEPFIIVDRAAAATMVPYTRAFTWVTRYPYYSRISAHAVEIPHLLWDAWRDIIQQRFAEAARTRPGLTLQLYLAETVVESSLLVQILADEHRDRVWKDLDFVQCVASYSFTAPVADIVAAIKAKPDFKADEAPTDPQHPAPLAFFHWLRQGESVELDKELESSFFADTVVDGVGTVGSLRILPELVLLQTFSKRKYEFARRMMDRFFGPVLTFKEEAFRDLTGAAQEQQRRQHLLSQAQQAVYGGGQPRPSAQAQPEGPGAEALREEETPESRKIAMEKMERQRWEKLLDSPAPILRGITPRVAAKDPALRERLTEFLKGQLYYMVRRNRDEGLDLNADWVLEDLGFHELKQPPGS